MVSIVPLALAPKAIKPLLAVAESDNAPADVSDDVVEILLLFDTDKLANVAPLEPRLSA
jgi:hypothetical protein